MLFIKRLSVRHLLALCLVLCCWWAPLAVAKGVYLTADEFKAKAFGNEPSVIEVVEKKMLWLSGDIKEAAKAILGRPFMQLRVRYWLHQGRTAWILEEIGKDQPITIGVVVEDQKIQDVYILAFRESRGSEVRYPFFTDQFQGIHLTEQTKLSDYIDGITGATMSVDAVTKVARLALFFHDLAVK